MAIKKAKIITVTSTKGGTGKTTTTLNLAGILSKNNKKVLIIDLDLYGGAIAASLNVDDTNNMYHIVNDMSNNAFDFIENYVSKYNDNIFVLASPKDPRMASKINTKYLELILVRAQTKFDVILIDTNHIIDAINLTVMDLSDKILYVLSTDSMDLKNMKTMVSIYKGMEKDNYLIILNEPVSKHKNYFSKYDIVNIIEDNIDYTIPSSFYIKNIDKYVLDGDILTLNKTICNMHKNAIKNFELIASNITKEEYHEEDVG